MQTTFLDALAEALKSAGDYAKDDQVAPAAILWPDAERQWEPFIPALRERLPLLTYGPYDPASRTGPSYWLRCMVERTLDDVIPESDVPIIYLPGVSKQDVRAIEEADQLLKPLAELQYRGALFTQKNGRDWTIAAFLQSADGGLGIEIGGDPETRAAILGARRVLAEIPVDEMQREAPLRAGYFNGKLQPDVARNVLAWLSDPPGYETKAEPAAWEAFRAQCRSAYNLDPVTHGPLTMAKELGLGQLNAWETVWQRFVESPERYPGLPERLRAARPKPKKVDGPTFWEKAGRWPQENDEAESSLRAALNALADTDASKARAALTALEQEHGSRRTWVWSALGKAPLAHALAHLAELARGTAVPLTGTTAPTLMAQYADYGWKTDDAALRALAAVDKLTDSTAVKAAVRTIYQPWLQHCAEVFQSAINLTDFALAYPTESLPDWPAGTCVVFSDGLRLDLAHRVEDLLKDGGLQTSLTTRFTALPSITDTAKSAVSPVANLFGPSDGLIPAVPGSGTRVDAGVLRNQLLKIDYQVLQGEETGDPAGRAWTETHNIDELGHQPSSKLPSLAEGETRILCERITALLEAGWKQVVVVTDHGWLYLPGDLPKVDLPIHLAEQNMRKGRCARLKPGASTELMTVPWYWDSEVQVAMAPGICCFQAGKVYEHGGLSPQECVTPVLSVSKPVQVPVGGSASLVVKWRNMRCDFETTNAPAGATVDIRSKAGDASTSLVDGSRALKPDGSASAPVADDSLLGHAAFAVLAGPDGVVIAQVTTTVGGEG